MKFIAIDTDILAYKAATSAETEIEWEPDIWTLFMDMNDAKANFTKQVDDIKSALGVDNVVCCLTDSSNNFRKSIDPGYKAGRKGTRKPVGYKALLQWIRDTYTVVEKPTLEADDCLGIIATKPENIGKCIIASDDKDLMTIPGQLYRPTKQERMNISEADADGYFYMQALTGDSVDSIPGLPGVGPKKAEAILGSRPTWSAVEQAYIKAGLSRDEAIKQARLVRILRWEDWSEEKQEVIPWTPKP